MSRHAPSVHLGIRRIAEPHATASRVGLVLLATAMFGCASPSRPTTTATLTVQLQSTVAADQASVDTLPVTVVDATGMSVQTRARNGLATFVVPNGQYDVGVEWLTPISRTVTVPPAGATVVVTIDPKSP